MIFTLRSSVEWGVSFLAEEVAAAEPLSWERAWSIQGPETSPVRLKRRERGRVADEPDPAGP